MSLLSPAITLANRLSFRAKFSLVAGVSCLAIILVYFPLLLQQQASLSRLELQHAATQSISPLRVMLEHIAKTRGMTNAYLNGATHLEGKIADERKIVDEAFAQLAEVERQYGEILVMDNELQQLPRTWRQITAQVGKEPAATTFANYSALIADVMNLMDTFARRGALYQDTDAVNSYLSHSLIITLPQQVEALGKLRGKGAGVIAAGNFTAENKLVLNSLARPDELNSLEKDMAFLLSSGPEYRTTLGSDFSTVEKILGDYLTLAREIVLSENAQKISSDDFFAQGTSVISSVLGLYDQMKAILVVRIDQQSSDVNQSIARNLGIIVLLILLLAYLFSGFYAAIRQNLDQTIHVANRVCSGDLGVRLTLDAQDEMADIAKSINRVVDSFAISMKTIRQASESIADTAKTLERQSHHTAEQMERQSNELTSSSAAITEMSSSVNEVASNAEQGAEVARSANQSAIQGTRVVNESVASINRLADHVKTSVELVANLEANSRSISSILDVIRGIAEQTNLLALNAAIEAARAGEQGRGFAVVADEVRTLAQRTQTSTHEINDMISLIQNGTGDVSKAMAESQLCAEEAVAQSQHVTDVLKGIAASVEKINDMSALIATAAEEQSYVSEDIAKSIETLTSVADEGARDAKALASVGTALQNMSRDMDKAISHYQVS